MLLKSLFSRKPRILVSYANNFQTNSKFSPYQSNDSGFLSEAQWFEKRNVILKQRPNLTAFKLIEQPITVKCGAQYQTWNKFSEIENLDSRLFEVLRNSGHDEMTQIQKHTFDILNNKMFDLLGSAETGSGKTIAFLSPILSSILKSYPASMMEEVKKNGKEGLQFPLFLVLAPTRELVQQIAVEAVKLLTLTQMKVVDVIGGVNIGNQISRISRGCHSIIATPGRLIDLVNKGVISLKYCNRLVLDEADRMLDMGFEPQIRQIIYDLGMPNENDRHTSMFSATFPKSVVELAQTLMNPNFGRIMVGRNAGSHETSIPESIMQSFVKSSDGGLFADGINFLKQINQKTIVFCNKKSDVDAFYRFARNQGLSVASLHGDYTQRQRDNELQAFKTNAAQVLIATAVAARGIDVSDVECVVNLGFPMNVDEYMHRVGRCGRMGRKGQATTFLLDSDLATPVVTKDLVEMLNRTNVPVPELLLEAQKNRLINNNSKSIAGRPPFQHSFRSTYNRNNYRSSGFNYRSNSFDDNNDNDRRSNFNETSQLRRSSFNYRSPTDGKPFFNNSNRYQKSDNYRSDIREEKMVIRED